jgi:hypothetical protein
LADKKWNGDTVRFRLAVPADIESLADLRWRLSTDDLPITNPLERKEFIAAFCSALPSIEACDRLVHFLAEREGQAIAEIWSRLVYGQFDGWRFQAASFC